MQILRKLVLVVILCSATVTWAEGGKSFDRVRYSGGSIASDFVKPDDLDGKLTVNAGAIVFALKDGQSVTIPPRQVTDLRYGQEAYRRTKRANTFAVVSVRMWWDFFHETKLHYIGISYTDKDGKQQGLLLQARKSASRAIIQALQGVTSPPVWVSDKEQQEIPDAITVQMISGKPEGPIVRVKGHW